MWQKRMKRDEKEICSWQSMRVLIKARLERETCAPSDAKKQI